MTCTINNTDPMDLRETLLFAVKDMSRLLSVSKIVDCENEKLLPEFISSVANDISLLVEVIINIKDDTGEAQSVDLGSNLNSEQSDKATNN
ncbi:hypothetical protein [Candidatus Thiodiazotropha sp. LNASS1]|uniref:hypothetical protein n=1 Tax=Candidatus Thiodiazotropha sp. LNASS1 TaxID=3096260 RepID=UPI0034DE65DC